MSVCHVVDDVAVCTRCGQGACRHRGTVSVSDLPDSSRFGIRVLAVYPPQSHSGGWPVRPSVQTGCRCTLALIFTLVPYVMAMR